MAPLTLGGKPCTGRAFAPSPLERLSHVCPGRVASRRGAGLVVRAAKRPKPAKLVTALPGTPQFEALKNMTHKGGSAHFEWYCDKFKPVREKAEKTLTLDFEKPLIELEQKIKDVKAIAEDSGLSVDDQIGVLEARAEELRVETYTRLTAPQKLQVARHPQRPTYLDIMMNICDNFVELHGDRAGYDDPAIVVGIATIDGEHFMCIGQQKGRNTKENVYRNFGMPQPNGYRKAMRYMRQAEKFGWPIITFIDTPGAFAGKNAEDQGQGEAIAYNLREMFGIRVPIMSVVLGEGGSGGALAIGCANHRFIMQNAVFFVASPEACASILWKDRTKVALAATVLKITGPELIEQGIMDEIIPEPLGGSHRDPAAVYPMIKKSLMDTWHNKYKSMSLDDVMLERWANFRWLGMVTDYKTPGGQYQQEKLRRATVKGVFTPAGTWAVDEEEKEYIMKSADNDAAFEELAGVHQSSINLPAQPPGLMGSGIMEVSLAAVELKLRYKLDEAREAIAERRKAQLAARGATVVEKELEEVVAKAPPPDPSPPPPSSPAAAVQSPAAEGSGAAAPPPGRGLQRRKSTKGADGELFFAANDSGDLMPIDDPPPA